MGRSSTSTRFLTPKKLKYAIYFFSMMVVKWRLSCFCWFINIKIIFVKYCQNGTLKVSKVYNYKITFFAGQRTGISTTTHSFRAATYHILTISYSLWVFIISTKLFQVGNFNVGIRPHLWISVYEGMLKIYVTRYFFVGGFSVGVGAFVIWLSQIFCVWIFCGCRSRGFCHSTESDLFLFLL